MSSKFNQYLYQSMAATGFCILDSGIAASFRPDLWVNGRECGGDFLDVKRRGFANPPGARNYLLRLKSIAHDLTLLARSSQQLVQRIEWITGMDVAELIAFDQLQGESSASAVARRAATSGSASGDQYRGVVTREAGRTCSGCEYVGAAGSCMKSVNTGIERPLLNLDRRCLEFKPVWGQSMDDRTGRQLWPELVAVPTVAT